MLAYPQDMQAWRAKRAEQALKNAVLDEEAAAKFSTAAAMEARVKREAAEKAHSDALFAATLGSGPEVHPFNLILLIDDGMQSMRCCLPV